MVIFLYVYLRFKREILGERTFYPLSILALLFFSLTREMLFFFSYHYLYCEETLPKLSPSSGKAPPLEKKIITVHRTQNARLNGEYYNIWDEICRVVTTSGCQCQSRNSPWFDPSILQHSGKSERRQMKQCWVTYIKRVLYHWSIEAYNWTVQKYVYGGKIL
jgi:hypothetical protein